MRTTKSLVVAVVAAALAVALLAGGPAGAAHAHHGAAPAVGAPGLVNGEGRR